jgi:hypothetical protein
MQHFAKILKVSLLGLALAAVEGCVALGLRAADYHPQIDPADFHATVDNPYFPLVPGTTMTYIEKAGGETSENKFAVTHDTKTIMGVKCVVVHDTVTQGGILKEDTFDWFTQDKRGTVWYFGEATKEFKAGGQVSTEGSWEAGVNGAFPGIVMAARPKLGEPYRQEYSRGEAEDMGQVVALDDAVTVPFGSSKGCVRTKEWSMLDSGSEKKWYAKGVGFIKSESTAGDVSELASVARE